jgi:hypothetical protein
MTRPDALNIKRRRRLFTDRILAERVTFATTPGWWTVTSHWIVESEQALLPEQSDLAYLSWPVRDLRQPSNWETFNRWHERRCAICGGGEPGTLRVDHDHATHLARGLLCSACNRHEGVHDNEKLSTYRLIPPAAIWGLVEFYDLRPDRAAIARRLEEIKASA